ncbi:hypothetical protein QJS10_CPB04g01573 [Acorus calamus]|uniref:Uncharacterized protein n=1 Tax=Acorus calamus TaxID=4465 RepID=A0AAV9F1K6_ACOCL|nr:hypothetical protein QJS10_CPB04g01573 [Acorus calamus]
MWSDCRNKGLRRSSVIWGNAVKKLEMDAVVAFCGMNGLMKMVERVPYIGNVDYWNVSLVHPQPNGSEAQSEDQLSMLKKVVIQHQPLLQVGFQDSRSLRRQSFDPPRDVQKTFLIPRG